MLNVLAGMRERCRWGCLRAFCLAITQAALEPAIISQWHILSSNTLASIEVSARDKVNVLNPRPGWARVAEGVTLF